MLDLSVPIRGARYFGTRMHVLALVLVEYRVQVWGGGASTSDCIAFHDVYRLFFYTWGVDACPSSLHCPPFLSPQFHHERSMTFEYYRGAFGFRCCCDYLPLYVAALQKLFLIFVVMVPLVFGRGGALYLFSMCFRWTRHKTPFLKYLCPEGRYDCCCRVSVVKRHRSRYFFGLEGRYVRFLWCFGGQDTPFVLLCLAWTAAIFVFVVFSVENTRDTFLVISGGLIYLLLVCSVGGHERQLILHFRRERGVIFALLSVSELFSFV